MLYYQQLTLTIKGKIDMNFFCIGRGRMRAYRKCESHRDYLRTEHTYKMCMKQSEEKWPVQPCADLISKKKIDQKYVIK